MLETLITSGLVLAFCSGVAVALWQRMVREVTVFEYERGLRFVEGRFHDLLGPGRYRWSKRSTTIQKADLRVQTTTLIGQEVLSADAITLKVSITARYGISDPLVALTRYVDYHQVLHTELQSAVREIIGAAPIDDLLARRSVFDAQLMELAAPRVAALGLQLLGANLRDVMLPGNLKNIFAQVIQARQEGLAALERARGETAALRNLANAARLLEQTPALFNLRLLQTLHESSGHTVVINTTPGPPPLPAAAQRVPAEPK